MSLELYYTDPETGDFILASDRVRLAALEVTMMATECAVGSSSIIIDDPEGTFYTPGHRPLYLVETEATGDEFAGIIGVFWTWNRQSRRGPYTTGPSREVVVNVKDLNTLLTMRVQKGGDAERPEENDVERVIDWLIDTTEVIGGFGDNGFSIEEREFAFEDSPVLMSETDYTAQDSAGVINDALQDSAKTAWLYNRATDYQPIRVGIWYGHTDRTDFTSNHSISNDMADVNIDPALATQMPAEYLIGGAWTFFPSLDADLDRDPSRQVTGAMVQWDGGSTYVSQEDPAPSLTHRDMVFSAELVKNEAQATRRGNSYLNRLENEDDAITCAVVVPAALVNGFHQGMRVPVRFTHFGPEGYAGDPVNMRVAARTVRQMDAGLYEIALDLRGESRPFSAPTPPGEEPPDYDSTIFARLTNASGPYPLPEGPVHWNGVPQLPWEATSDEFDYVETGLTGHRWSGIQLTADGTLQSVVMIVSWIGVGVGTNDPYTVTIEILQNGTPIAEHITEHTVVGASNLFAGRPRLEARDVAVSTGDVISGRVSCIGANGQAMEFFRVPHGIDPGVLIIRGGDFS